MGDMMISYNLTNNTIKDRLWCLVFKTKHPTSNKETHPTCDKKYLQKLQILLPKRKPCIWVKLIFSVNCCINNAVSSQPRLIPAMVTIWLWSKARCWWEEAGWLFTNRNASNQGCIAISRASFQVWGRARRFPLPDGPGQVKLPVRQVDLDRFFFFISYKQIEEFQNSWSRASDDFEKRRALMGSPL